MAVPVSAAAAVTANRRTGRANECERILDIGILETFGRLAVAFMPLMRLHEVSKFRNGRVTVVDGFCKIARNIDVVRICPAQRRAPLSIGVRLPQTYKS